MANARDLLFLSAASCAFTVGNAIGTGVVAAIRGTPIAESVRPTSAGVAVASSAFTLFSAVYKVHADYVPPLLHVGGSIAGALSAQFFLEMGASSIPVMDPVINSIVGYPIALGVTYLFLNAFMSLERNVYQHPVAAVTSH